MKGKKDKFTCKGGPWSGQSILLSSDQGRGAESLPFTVKDYSGYYKAPNYAKIVEWIEIRKSPFIFIGKW